MTRDEQLFQYLLQLGDSPLILAQRLGEWVGHGPVLEEDIALTNVGLDLLGQARLWLSYAGEVEARSKPPGRDEDALAFLRESGQFRNLLLVEQPAVPPPTIATSAVTCSVKVHPWRCAPSLREGAIRAWDGPARSLEYLRAARSGIRPWDGPARS